MTPNDLDEYLQVLKRHEVGAAHIKLEGGDEIAVSFVPKLELPAGTDPVPGGWKTLTHLDDPHTLRENQEYKGDLPS